MTFTYTALYNDFEEWFIQITLRYGAVKSKLCLKKLVPVLNSYMIKEFEYSQIVIEIWCRTQTLHYITILKSGSFK